MIRLDLEQGSPAWIIARLGIPTASQFKRVITPKTRKLASGCESYLCELIAERMLGESLDPFVSEWMERGTELEPQAVDYYELQTETETEVVGHCMTDDRRAGCSPDRLAGDHGGLEIKCPSAPVHVSYHLADPIKFAPQVQGCMWITGRRWWDFMSFHPDLPPVLKRFERDDEYIADLSQCVGQFCKMLDAAMDKLGWDVPSLKEVV